MSFLPTIPGGLQAKTSYDLQSSEYPANTWTELAAFSDKANDGKSAEFVIKLPLPNQLAYTTTYDWSSENVPVVAQNIIDKVNSGAQTTDQALKALKEGAIETYHQTKDFAQKMMIEKLANGLLGGGGSGSYVLSTVGNGQTYNPNKILFFNGVSNTPLNMSFDLIPQNSSQATKMAEAIKALRIAAAPGYTQGNYFFTYPSYFSIAVVVNSRTVMQFSPIAITSIATNLTPQSNMAWHSDSKPTAFTMEIQAIEAIVPSKDVQSQRPFLS